MILGFGGVQCFRALGWEQVFSLLFVHHFPCSNSLSFILVFPSSSIFCSSSSWVCKFRHLHQVQNSQMVSCLFSSYFWCLSSPCCFWRFYSLRYFCCLFFELTFFYGLVFFFGLEDGTDFIIMVIFFVCASWWSLFCCWLRILMVFFFFWVSILLIVLSIYFLFVVVSTCFLLVISQYSSFPCSSSCSSSPCYFHGSFSL